MEDIYMVTDNGMTLINGNNINIVDYNIEHKKLTIEMNNPNCKYIISDIEKDSADAILLNIMNPNSNQPVVVDMVRGKGGPKNDEEFYVL